MVDRVANAIVQGAGNLLYCRSMPSSRDIRYGCECQRGSNGTCRDADGYIDPNCLFHDKELLYDGCAYSGKTYQDALAVHRFALAFPGSRQLVLRETQKALRESFQPTYEDEILGRNNEILKRGGARDHRTSYDYLNSFTDYRGREVPGSHVALDGTDRIELQRSTAWDRILLIEATDPRIAEKQWVTLLSRNRGRRIPHPHCQYPDGVVTDGEHAGQSVEDVLIETKRFADRVVNGRRVRQGEDDYGCPLFFRQAVAECNPDPWFGVQHWLYLRWRAGHMARIKAVHGDNPVADAAYIDTLRSLPEPYRSVYYEGVWPTSSEGRCWPSYNPTRHLVRGEFKRHPLTAAKSVTIWDWLDAAGNPRTFPIASVVAGFDWGRGHAGSLQIFAVTPGRGAEKRAFRIAELHFHDQEIDWWAEKVVELVDKYRIEAILCDPSAVAIWSLFNKYLGPRQGRQIGGICNGADNTHATERGIMGGIELVRTMFSQDRLHLFTECHEGPIDVRLQLKRMPTGLHQEIIGYMLATDPNDPQKVLPHPDKKRGKDDAVDAARYALCDIFDHDRQLKRTKVVSPAYWDRFNGLEVDERTDRERLRDEILNMPERPERTF